VLHNVLELRYVTGGSTRDPDRPVPGLLGALITGVVVCRLLPVSAVTRGVEIGLSYVLLACACVGLWSAGGWLALLVCRAAPRPCRSPSRRTTSWC
jgi:hypothetical protein